MPQLMDLCGEWSGTKTLYLSWLPEPEHHSASHLVVKSVAMGKFIELSYSWSHENQTQEGLLLLGQDQAEATAAWVDSWHQNTRVMALTGNASDGGLSLKGSFAVPPGPDWGWRIELEQPGTDELRLSMFTIDPATDENTLAVKIDYQRSSCGS